MIHLNDSEALEYEEKQYHIAHNESAAQRQTNDVTDETGWNTRLTQSSSTLCGMQSTVSNSTPASFIILHQVRAMSKCTRQAIHDVRRNDEHERFIYKSQ